jgi:hypothetical protein
MARLTGHLSAILLIFGLAIQASAFAAETPRAEGWTIAHGDNAMVCVATENTKGEARLSLATEGPMFLLMVEASDLPPGKDSYTAALSFDGKPPVQAPALGGDGLISIQINRGTDANTVVTSSRVSIAVNGHTHEFPLNNTAAALDAVARCAGQQTLAEQKDLTSVSIPGAGTWRLELTLPGLREPVCEARIAGDQIDTIMILNDRGDLVLMGGHTDWATWGGDVSLQLSIDGARPVSITASTLNNLILALVKDPELVQRLRAAKTLEWTIPTGHVRGDVAGLGAAMDAVKACKARAAAK